MSGRAATTDVIPGKYALAVGIPDKKLAPGWTWRRLTDVAEMATGHTPSRNHPNYWDGDIAWIGIKDAREFHGRRITTTFQTVTQAGIDNSASVLLPANTVCLSRTASVGYVTIMDRPMATSQDFVNWKCSDALVPEFLMYLLIAERDSLFKFGKGTTHTTIYFPEAKALCAGLPPPAEQRRIVAKIEELFSDLDAGVAALERVRANLKRYRAAVLKAAVEGHLTEEWRKQHPATEPAAKLLERIVAERRAKWEQDQLRKFKEAGKAPPKGWKEKYEEPPEPADLPTDDLPERWTWGTLLQLGSVDRGRSRHRPRDATHLYGGPYPFVQTGDIGRANTFIRSYTQTYSDAGLAQSRLWPKGTLCITIAANIAETAILDIDACFPDSVVGFAPAGDGVSVRYVELYFRTVQKNLERWAPATAQKNINVETLTHLPVRLPPAAEQAEIVAEVDRRLSVADAAETQVEHALQRAARLRQAILKRAFEGKLAPQGPTDEPGAGMPSELPNMNKSFSGSRASPPIVDGKRSALPGSFQQMSKRGRA